MPRFEHILVPVDFSPCSRSALEHAQSLAEEYGANIDVLHVWYPPRYIGPDTELAIGQNAQTLWDYARAAAAKDFDEFLGDFHRRPAVKLTARLEQGSPEETILGVAKAGDFDLIVMGTRGRTGLSHAFLGSVAERVVRNAPCPVMTVHAEHHTVSGPAYPEQRGDRLKLHRLPS